jgi:uncharacterized protein with PQ loop repeat
MYGGFHHLHTRKAGKNLREMPFYDKLMYVVAIVSPLVLIPQVAEIWLNKNAVGISLSTWVGLGIVSVLWLIYGVKHRAVPIIISNSLVTLINIAVAMGALLYR